MKKIEEDRLAAAKRVAARLFALEHSIDACISEAGALVTELPIARREGKISAVVGQDAFVQAAAILPVLVAARAQIVQTHHGLTAFQAEAGMQTISFGGGWKELAPMGLHIVEQRAA